MHQNILYNENGKNTSYKEGTTGNLLDVQQNEFKIGQ